MSKALRVAVMFEFDGIDDPDGEAATDAINGIQEELFTLGFAYGADAVWIDDASVVSGGREVECK